MLHASMTGLVREIGVCFISAFSPVRQAVTFCCAAHHSSMTRPCPENRSLFYFCVFACTAGSHFLLCRTPFFDDPALPGKSEFVLFLRFRLCGRQSLFVVPHTILR
jgi:hypothetical protein